MIIERVDAALLKKALKGAAGLLEANKEEVNALNVFPVPDGDTGTNMSLTFKSAAKEGLSVNDDDAYLIALAMSKGSLMGARGNSGVILSQLCRGFAEGLKGQKEINVETLALAFKKASDMAYQAVMKPTEGTILTVARECGDFAINISRQETDILRFLERVIEHGNTTLDKTPDMLPVLKQAGVVDAGGKGLMYIITGGYNALAGVEQYEGESIDTTQKTKSQRQHIDTDDIEFGYCTEFMINTDYSDIESLREELAVNADSLLVVGGDGIIKVHIHTNNPGKVMERALELGELSDIKIDNMRYQHEEVLLKDELNQLRESDEKKEEKLEATKEYSFVSISTGKGIDKMFEEFSVDKIVSGGQTMNPSTEDILKAIESTEGKNVFILPNNKNIIWAADQTKELSDRNVIVVPTTSIPEGVGALIAFDESLSPEENLENMVEYINHTKTGEITFAVRDTEVNGKKIKKDNIIGLSQGEIVSVGTDLEEIALELVDEMMDEDKSILTVFYGEDVDEDKAQKLTDILEDKYSDIDVELIYGGQPLYYYVFSLE